MSGVLHDALLQTGSIESDIAADFRAAGGWPPPDPKPAPDADLERSHGAAVRLPRRPAGLRADQMDAWEGEAADWYGGPDPW